MDIDALQDNLVSVAFCDINSEIDTRYVDTNFIKLFQLAQLLIEYLLYSQDYLTNTVDSLRLENETIKKETEALKKRLEQQAQRLTSTQKECHRRRLLLLAQQRLMNSGPQSYHRCPHCAKAFINASFLNAHLFRRHAEVISALQDIDLNHASLLPLDSGTSFIVEKGNNEKPPVLAPNLEQQIQEVLDHLKSQIPPPPPPPLPLTSAVVQTIEAKGAASPRASAAVEAAWRQRAAELERQLEEERDHLRQLEERNRAWQVSVASQYRADVERVKEMFEVELRNLREENLETQRQLIQLRIKRANVSNFEDVEADIPEQLELQVRSLEAPPKREECRPYNEAELGNNRIVQLADDRSNKSEYAKERVSKSHSTTQPNAEKSHNPLQANGNLDARLKYVPLGSELRVDPLEGISHYKDQLEGFRSDPDAMKRLRKEVESLLVEQLIDHDVDGDAGGLTRGKFTETLDTLGQERQHLTRKHPNFAEIRASIARKVDRMALIALHSKRGRHDSALRGGSNGFGGGDGDVDGEGLQKKPRASRIADRDALSRPPSGRPASLTSLTHTLSPIAEHRRFATASPALRKTNPTQSKQSLFENTEDEEDDGDGRVVKVEGRTAVYRAAKKFHQSMNEEVDDRFQSKNQSPGHSVKFSDENESRKNNNPGEDDDDDGPVSVFSILSEEQGDIGLSPMSPETRKGERADPVASSVTTLSPLRPGASYTISTSQWDTSSQVNDNQRFGRGEADDRLDSDA
ncbi:daz interacting protein 1 [Echinococcus multilocularis]|uniref:Daz interacting protein 1 n=1 Tax=Echinococcus multilocularis TaxID=6211 RepID=A0A068Y5J9_ECHMU|nr:daz interacting protein 1 [Echinococcus multilocularis]